MAPTMEQAPAQILRPEQDLGAAVSATRPQDDTVATGPHARSRWRWLTSPWFHVALILLIAGFFRLWQIGHLPPGLFGDEATDGLDALDVLRGHGAVFFPANFGREGLHIWIVAAAFRLMGISSLALRLPSALAGILTAVATYWLGRELATAALRSSGHPLPGVEQRVVSPFPHREGGMPRSVTGVSDTFTHLLAGILPLTAALYLGTSYWHIHFSRFGIRGVFTPLCAALAFAAFWRGLNAEATGATEAKLRTKTLLPPSTNVWFAVSGAFLGLGAHFYTAGRFLPVFLAGYLVLEWLVAALVQRGRDAILPRHWRSLILLYTVAAVVFAPLAWYFLTHPGSFSQRASAVSAFSTGGHPWARMLQAGWANVLQFFLPGRGDMAQFYNLPGRPVFDALTAVLALIGIGVLLWRWRQAWALFLLAWWPALLVPAFLATDRYPTLPRVLGTIPGVYFFPAVGLIAIAWLAVQIRRGVGGEVALLICAAALLVHAGLSYRDYFQVWAPSAATFDAFEGDMAAASDWLAANTPTGHVYLSSDIYRHPTFMLLHEHATVLTYFDSTDPALSWFDASSAFPLPPAGQPATYLLAASPSPTGAAGRFLIDAASLRDEIDGPDGNPALLVMELPAGATWDDILPIAPVRFSPALTLVGATWEPLTGGAPLLRLRWQTDGPQPQDWSGYRLEVGSAGAAGAEAQNVQSVPLDGFRASEWVAGGQFLSWHHVSLAGEPAQLRLRLVHADTGQPLISPDAPDGWREIEVK